MLTQEKAKQLFSYDPHEGILRWREWSRGRRADLVAGCPCRKKGKPTYLVVRVGQKPGKLYPVHQIVWLYMTGEWPDTLIDHEDLDGENNKFINLRKATNGQNMMNGRLRADNKTGVKGISMHRNGMFRVRINVDGKEIFLGRFYEFEKAVAVRKEAQIRYHGEFARDA
jgi:hypothetical protein